VADAEMRHPRLISTAESLAVVVPCTRGNVRVTIFIAIIHVWPAMIVIVFACTFNAVVIALTLDILKFLGRCVPSTLALSVLGR
jgi:hypothetical protein